MRLLEDGWDGGRVRWSEEIVFAKITSIILFSITFLFVGKVSAFKK
jgi:hypothetical protein